MELKNKLSTGLGRFVAAVLVAIVLAGSYCYASRNQSVETAAPTTEVHENVVAKSAGSLPDFVEIAARQGSAVVNISVAGKMKSGIPGLPTLDPDDPFYEFFKRLPIPSPQGNFPSHGLGSGFIISPDGVILTNAHLVSDADEVTVKLTDKREFRAKVVGADKPSDVAVLKIDARDLPTVRIGSSQNARVGEWVVAIGSPFGFENSVTAGIISAKSRSLPDEGYVPFLQTDVAINPGNSGGPLFNMDGKVIGINSQIYSRSGGYQGLSFAIPIEVAMKIEKQLLDHGKVSRGQLGIVIQEVNQALADSFGLEKPVGALVSEVEKGSPAEHAGIESGDVILKFNGKEIMRFADLPPLVADVTPDSSATIELWHQGKAKAITIKVGEMKATAAKAKPDIREKGKLGLSVRLLTPDERKNMEVPDGGLLVEEISDGPAARSGIRTNDVILSVNGEKVNSAEQLKNLTQKYGRHLALQIMRGDLKMFVAINLDQGKEP